MSDRSSDWPNANPSFACACRFKRERDFGPTDLIEACGYHEAMARERLELRNAEESSVGEAIDVLFKALDWGSGGLGSAAIEIVRQRDEARALLREVRDGVRNTDLMLCEASLPGRIDAVLEKQSHD